MKFFIFSIYFPNVSIIAITLVEVPIMKPHKPKTPITIFFVIITAFPVFVFCSFKNTHVSNKAGNASPSEDKHKAPNNDMNKSSFGIATANRTANEKNLILKSF